jgi:multidrug resistance efflux pump
MKKVPFIILTVTVFLIALTACSPKATETPVTATTATNYSLISEGSLHPVDSLDHSFTLSGQVAEVLVQDGEQVEAGQVLARLVESPDVALALARAEQEALAAQQALDDLQSSAQVNLANSRLAVIQAQDALEQAQTRLDGNDTAENQALLDIVQAGLDMAEQTLQQLEAGNGVDPDLQAAAQARISSAGAALTSAQAARDAFTLKANRAGTIVDLTLKTGQKVAAGSPVITVADYSTWVVKTDNLTETDVVNLTVGQKVEVVLDALPEVTLSGEVTHINARFEEKRGDITYTVTILLSQTAPQMRWGMTAAVNFLP